MTNLVIVPDLSAVHIFIGFTMNSNSNDTTVTLKVDFGSGTFATSPPKPKPYDENPDDSGGEVKTGQLMSRDYSSIDSAITEQVSVDELLNFTNENDIKPDGFSLENLPVIESRIKENLEVIEADEDYVRMTQHEAIRSAFQSHIDALYRRIQNGQLVALTGSKQFKWGKGDRSRAAWVQKLYGWKDPRSIYRVVNAWTYRKAIVKIVLITGEYLNTEKTEKFCKAVKDGWHPVVKDKDGNLWTDISDGQNMHSEFLDSNGLIKMDVLNEFRKDHPILDSNGVPVVAKKSKVVKAVEAQITSKLKRASTALIEAQNLLPKLEEVNLLKLAVDELTIATKFARSNSEKAKTLHETLFNLNGKAQTQQQSVSDKAKEKEGKQQKLRAEFLGFYPQYTEQWKAFPASIDMLVFQWKKDPTGFYEMEKARQQAEQQDDQPAEPIEPDKPVEQTEPVEPDKPAEPVKSAKLATPKPAKKRHQDKRLSIA